jgi:hypothetical protein
VFGDTITKGAQMTKLINLIHSQISKPKSVATYKSDPAFKPSAVGSPCLRKIAYSYLRVPEDYEASVDLKKYGIAGDAAHTRISEYLRQSGVLVDYHDESGKTPTRFGKIDPEFPLKDKDLEISAKIDAILILEGKLWIGEWKTISKFPFQSLKAPKDDHLMQGSIYRYIFKKALAEGQFSHIKALNGFSDVEGVIYLYECRDNFELKEFIVRDLSKTFVQVVDKMMTVKQYIDNGQIPPRTADYCNSCPWRDKCAKDSLL